MVVGHRGGPSAILQVEAFESKRAVSKQKLRIANTELDNLVSNLRGEVGEVITTWVMMRHFGVMGQRLSTDDLEADLANSELSIVFLLEDKLRDELVGRLSELAERKIGQLTFYFASQKLGSLHGDCKDFGRFIVKAGIREKRNLDVSHKVLPEKWGEHRFRHIDGVQLLKATAMAVRLMKRIDRQVLGPAAPYLWREARKKRYDFNLRPRVSFPLMAHVRLSDADRVAVLQAELDEGFSTLSLLKTKVNGETATVRASKKWGILVLGDRLVPLEVYPLQEVHEITLGPRAGSGSDGETKG